MRVYLPTTLRTLVAAREAGRFAADGADGIPGHAVTGVVREWYVSGDLEELEYAVLLEAAEASLSLIAAELATDPGAQARRVVVAADVADTAVSPSGGAFRSAVRISQPVGLDLVASVHVDEPEAEPAVRAAVAALPAAGAGDDDARFLLDEAGARNLLWYDASELHTL